ncbi:DUF4301 family protein [Marinilactibacillus sp. Marseille-P9653]|uniref:DUF4301 family protein n=1 Tax=Marinilactibacillus sp. Marseille-P9653 TaxID=2866583 RepID=UPI001CE3D260|nr:DUF4301 family protein [Marinilactibacillus sp. Marseille-P9653]
MSVQKFEVGTKFVNIKEVVTQKELTELKNGNNDYKNQQVMKFVPASGAATRMFKDLHSFLVNHEKTEFVNYFLENIESYPFVKDIDKVEFFLKENNKYTDKERSIIDNIINEKLQLSSLPKALIKMHDYGTFVTTPIDEHIYEGEQYLNDENVKLHFTISEEHEELFNEYVEEAIKDQKNINITYSFQKPETNTIAVDMDNKPFLLENGEILYRPGGHGSLIENLNDLEADIIFIKNIDNVCHRSRIKETIDSKKQLASIGLDTKKQINQYIESLLTDDYNLEEIKTFLKDTLNITLKSEWTKEKALHFLDRPFRVCGVVENSGEPGGGPFIVDNGSYLDLQICETSEIDLNDEEKLEILKASQYFNPVDLVCFVKNHKGDKYDLTEFVNEDRYFITEKTHNGRNLKALEHPGLWNGAMHHWNTLFVEVPSSTFNPVKTVNDLLRDGHREAVQVK